MQTRLYKFNPFSGVLDEDIASITIPKYDTKHIAALINGTESVAIEFVGKQGRGKTTNLRYLQQQFSQYPLFLLDDKTAINSILNTASDVVFVDSIHHLSMLDRIKLFKAKKTVIYTTHWTRRLTCLITKKQLYRVPFKGIDASLLQQLLNKRLELAAKDKLSEKTLFTVQEAQTLINTYSDNYRGIINHLYTQYQ